MPRKLIARLLLGLGSGLVLLLGWSGVLDVQELKTYDWRIRRAADPSSVHQDIALVHINDTSIRDFSNVIGRWPWPRIALASVIDFLKRAPARVIAIDLGIWEPDNRLLFKYGDDTITGTDSDTALVNSIKGAGSVVMLADAVYHGLVEGDQKNATDFWTSPPYKLAPAIEARPLLIAPVRPVTKASAAIAHNLRILDQGRPDPYSGVRRQRRRTSRSNLSQIPVPVNQSSARVPPARGV